jgi:hypothetical protein
MNSIDRLKKINKQRNRVSQLIHNINERRNELIKKVGEELYGNPGDLIVITDSNGIPRQAKILYVEESFWSDQPRCILEIDGNLTETKIQTHINSPEKIVKKL